MDKGETDFSYTISENALTKIAETAAFGVQGVIGKKGRGIVVKNSPTMMTADVHIQVAYGMPLRTVALTVQQHVADALRAMTDPKQVVVQVTIEDVVM